MDRIELANEYHHRGFNCCQSVVAAFSDVTGLDEKHSLDVSSGFGSGAGTGELCGALAGALMVMSLTTPVDMEDPIGSKQRSVAFSREVQKRFREKFGAVRCQELLKKQESEDRGISDRVRAMPRFRHCDTMVLTAVEIAEEILRERGLI